MRAKFKYFPFSPGIRWKISKRKYIIPEISGNVWNASISGKDVVVVAHGGIFESFTSLSLLELVNHQSPSSKIFWNGDKRFNSLIELNGLAKIYDGMDKDTARKYPAPIFFDKDNHVYFNCLNNYITSTSYDQERSYTRIATTPFQQIVENSTQPWDDNYLPKFRRLNCSKELTNWANISRIKLNDPYICIFPERTGLSIHNESCLGWKFAETRALAAMLGQMGINSIIFSSGNHGGYSLPLRFDYIISLLGGAKAVLSEEVDWLLLANVLGSAKLASKKLSIWMELHRSDEFFNRGADIYVNDCLEPRNIFEFIQEKT